MRGKEALIGPTWNEIGSLDFPFGHNAPHDCQDFQDSRLSTTLREKQGVVSASEENQLPASLASPLAEYVSLVYEWHKQQPGPAPGHWQSPLFGFARFVKSHPEMIELTDYEAAEKIEDLMSRWSGRPSSVDPWKFFFPQAADGEAARMDFMASFSAVRHVPFRDLLANALRLADEKPLRPPHWRAKLYVRFVSLAGWLQVLLPGQPILLPTRKLDTLLRCDQRTVSRLRGFAVQDGLLRVVKASCFRPNQRRATEFRFALEQYPELLRRKQ